MAMNGARSSSQRGRDGDEGEDEKEDGI